MTKLYKNVGGLLRYHEAWERDGVIIEHFGKVGDQGEIWEHEPNPESVTRLTTESVLSSARANGYLEISEEEHTSLVLEYPVKESFASEQELNWRNEVSEQVDQLLGWTGLGKWTGSSSGSGTMKLAYLVVDFELAKRVIEEELKKSQFLNYSRIYNARD